MALQQNFDLETPTPLRFDDYEFDDYDKLDPPNIQACIDKDRKELIPIKKVEYSIKIDKGLEIYKVKQFYQNIQNEPIMVDFLFHVSKMAVLTQLQFELEGNKYTASVIEKKEAKQQFQKGIKDGMTMSYSSYDNIFKDLIRVQIGNLASYKELILEFTYIQPLQLIGGNFYQIKIGSVNLNDKQQKVLPKVKPYKMDYKQIIEIEIQMKNITYCKSHTHEIQIEKDVKGEILIVFCQMETQKEFNLLFQNEDEQQEIILSQANSDNLQEMRYCATIMIDPRFKKFKQDDAKSKKPQTNNILKKHIMFIFDLRGDYLKEKKQVILQFLKNLDKNTLFNILIIDNKNSKLLKDFEYLSKQKLEQVNNWLTKAEQFKGKADLDIEELIESDKDQSVIYIGSDNTDQYFDTDITINYFMIRNHNQHFIEQADAFQGFYDIIDYFGENNVDNKIKRFLEQIDKPRLSKFQMTSDLQSIQCMIPNPQSILQLSNNKILYIYIIFNTKQKEIFFSLQCYNAQLQQDVFHQIEVKKDSCINTDNYHKIVGKKLIKKLHNAFIKQKKRINKVLIRQDSLSKNDMLNYSLQYQIISPMTAFICELDRLNDIDFQIIQKKVTFFHPENDQLDEDEIKLRYECESDEEEQEQRLYLREAQSDYEQESQAHRIYEQESEPRRLYEEVERPAPKYDQERAIKFENNVYFNNEPPQIYKDDEVLKSKQSNNKIGSNLTAPREKLSSLSSLSSERNQVVKKSKLSKESKKSEESKNKQSYKEKALHKIKQTASPYKNQKSLFDNQDGIKDSKGQELIKYELQSTVQQGIKQPMKSPKYSILSSSKFNQFDEDRKKSEIQNKKVDANMIKSTTNKKSSEQQLLESQYIQTERIGNQAQSLTRFRNTIVDAKSFEYHVDEEPRIQMIKGFLSKNRKLRQIKDNQDDLNLILSYFSHITKCFDEKIQDKLDFSGFQRPEQLNQLQWVNILVIELLVTRFQNFESQWIKIQQKVEEWLMNELISVLSFFQFRRLGHKLIKQQQLQIQIC